LLILRTLDICKLNILADCSLSVQLTIIYDLVVISPSP